MLDDDHVAARCPGKGDTWECLLVWWPHFVIAASDSSILAREILNYR